MLKVHTPLFVELDEPLKLFGLKVVELKVDDRGDTKAARSENLFTYILRDSWTMNIVCLVSPMCIIE